MLKKCKKCNLDLPITEFYKHKKMYDGHLNFCKTCVKSRVGKHRELNLDKIRQYDKKRSILPHRIALNIKTTRVSRGKHPGYSAAHNAISRAIANGGIIKPKICSWCGSDDRKIESHHPDYSRQLFVYWLCVVCHRKLHLGKTEEAKAIQKVIPAHVWE